MRPCSIEFQAFGPYAGYEKVDFETLSKEGLFLICGKTGTGKTMILDAMTFALYGKSSGKARDDFEAMRCTRADFNAVTFVKFIFENNGEYYCFERRLERKRKNLSASYNVSRKDAQGNWIALFENAKADMLYAKAVEIIGLEYDQFRQVIVLPQGQFEKLLTSDSSEKEKILTSIFGEDQWQKIADHMYDDAKERVDELKKDKEAITSRLQEEGCESTAHYLLLIEQKQQEFDDLKADYEAKDCEGLMKEMSDALTVAKRFGDLHRAEKTAFDLSSMKEQYDQLRVQKDLAERAEGVRSFLEAVVSCEKNLAVRAAAETRARESVSLAKTAEMEAMSELTVHIASKDEIEGKKEKKAQLDAKRPEYEQIDQAKKSLAAANEALEEAKTTEERAKKHYDGLISEVEEEDSVVAKMERECELLTDQYFADIAFEIAGNLEEGKACPVCGSTTHPHLAVAADEIITKKMVADKRSEVKKEKEHREQLVSSRDAAKTAYETKQADTADKKAKAIEWDAKCKSVKANLVAGVDTLEQLDAMIASLKKEIDAYDIKKAALEESAKAKADAHTQAKTTYALAKKEHGEARKALEDAKTALQKALAAQKFASEDEARSGMLSPAELKSLQNKIAQYDANVKASKESLDGLKKELAGLQEPDEAACRVKYEQALEQKDQYAKKSGQYESELRRMKEKYEQLLKLGDGLEERVREAEEDLALARKLRGDSGIGLQRYVLGIMFSSVVGAANKMLEMVHGGRYRLFRSDDKGQGNKRGLELKVHDSNSMEHEGRFVNTLSGGEKFLASLALSIGMSTVAQRSGIRIEALFIDEGFGSLDEDSINDALDILKSIKDANGFVGIISHVKILQDHIGAKLRVEEDGAGSRILQTIG